MMMLKIATDFPEKLKSGLARPPEVYPPLENG